MIYILVGSDNKKKKGFINNICKGVEVVYLPLSQSTKEELENYAESASLFGDMPIIIIDNALSTIGADLSKLHGSPTTFIFLEDKMLVAEEKKYKKFATTERFELKEIKKTPVVNTFAIADAFGRSDKVKAWMLYREAIESGVAPEAISGILFWKIKTMLLSSSGSFSRSELRDQSSKIVSLYHESHRGEKDFIIGLEQFILLSLDQKNK